LTFRWAHGERIAVSSCHLPHSPRSYAELSSTLDFFARIPDNITDLNSTTTFYNIVGFDNPWHRRSREYDFSPKILLATFTDVANGLKPPGSTTQTNFGNVPHFTFDLYHNMTKWKTVEVWGVECTRYQHLGHINVTRFGG